MVEPTRRDLKPKNPKPKANVVEDNLEEDESSNVIDAEMGYLFLIDKAEKKLIKMQRQRERDVNSNDSPIPHFIWDQGEWSVRPNRSHPMVKIRYRLCKDGYQAVRRPCLQLRSLRSPLHQEEALWSPLHSVLR